MKSITLTLAGLALSGTLAASELPVFKWSAADLTTLEGIASTHERIEATANRYCQDHLRGTRGLSRSSHCVRAVVEEIVFSVDDQRLTAYARTGKVADDLLAKR